MPYKDLIKRREHHTEYMRKWNALHRNKVNAEASARYWKNPEAKRAADRKRYQENREQQVKRSVEYFKTHPEKKRFHAQKYRSLHSAELSAAAREREALRFKAMPKWVDKSEILKFYKSAKSISHRTGIPHHVDHIWPLRGVGFVGLHVPWNLRVITAAENMKKGNRLPCGV